MVSYSKTTIVFIFLFVVCSAFKAKRVLSNILLTATILLTSLLQAQDTTKVIVDLNGLVDREIQVKVFPPSNKTVWEYVVPEIIPGTYMKINYVRFYKQIKALDKQGNKLKISRKKNVFKIEGNEVLNHITYTVKPSLGDLKIWDNILACGGSIFTSKSALLNFQLVNGYFEGYEDKPFEVEVNKPNNFYGASSIQKSTLSPSKDLLFAKNYGSLIDQPILYSEADTCSFKIRNNEFRIAIHAEAGKVTADKLKPRFKAIMHAIDTFSGFTTKDPYVFLLYFADVGSVGFRKGFGLGSALEHKNSSVYYNRDEVYDTTFAYYNWIAAHEYFHTITPLGLHSEKIANFNFRKADMSRHTWMYEGITDYFAFLLNAQSFELNKSGVSDLAKATATALKHRRQRMAESSKNIIRRGNIISWIRKIFQIFNFYEKGKLIALGMDLELMEKSQGKRRLNHVMLEMKKDFDGSFFPDSLLPDILERYAYQGFKEYYNQYIEMAEIPPYEKYFEKFGWTFYPKNSKLLSYGGFYIKMDKTTGSCYVSWQKKKNSMGLLKGDTVVSINNRPVTEYRNFPKEYYKTIGCPQRGDSLSITVIRKGKLLELEGRPKPRRIKSSTIRANREVTKEQIAYRKLYFNRKRKKQLINSKIE